MSYIKTQGLGRFVFFAHLIHACSLLQFLFSLTDEMEKFSVRFVQKKKQKKKKKKLIKQRQTRSYFPGMELGVKACNTIICNKQYRAT